MISKKQFVVAATVTVFAAVTASAGTQTPKREFRSTWFTTHVNIDWPQNKGTSETAIAKQKADMISYIEGFERMNLNGACFQVRAQCDAVYKSSYEPWSAVLTGTRGLDPGWDPLQFCIDQCHERGLECYAWINPFRWSTGTDYNTPQDKEVKDKGWVLSYGGYYVLNPAIPEAREHILKVCKEIVDNYAIDGVLFDDYFYPNNIPENSSAGDWDLYKSSGTTMSIGDWRRENINIFVRDFQKMIEEAHPDMRFGISPAGVAGDANTSAGKYGVTPNPVAASDWQYSTIYSDPLAWVSEGSIDFISPQIYWQTYHATAPYEPLCQWWSYIADLYGRHFYSSQNVYFFTSANNVQSWNEVTTEVRLNRQYAEPTTLNAPGTIYYSSKYFYGPALSGLGDHLLNTVNQTKALVPVVTWKKVPSFEAPENLIFDGTNLKWDAIEAPRSIMRYTVYAVPIDISTDEAMEESGDGISNDYLLKVSYSTTFELPADKRDGYWFAVCAYDGLGNEYAPAIVNYSTDPSQKVELVSPADNASIGWDETFEWSGIAAAKYVFRLAKDEKFSDIVLTSDRIEDNKYSPDLSSLKPETKYFWNVICYEPGRPGTPSEVRSCTTRDYIAAPAITLVSPEEGADFGDNLSFSWTPETPMVTYTLEIATDESFDNVVLTRTTADTTVSIIPSLLGRGKFFWRVKGNAPFTYDALSATRSFTISSISIGETEPGYTIKQDAAIYPSVDGVTVENLWVRANNGDFNNITFENNGMMERSMVAAGDYVYLTRRSENSEGALLFLEKYDGLTGEHVVSIELGDEARKPYFPLNTVVRDEAGNLAVANLSLNATTTPVYLHLVDTGSGDVTEVAKIQLSGLESARVDHVNVLGDMAAGNFLLFFTLSSTANIVRLTYVNGSLSETKIFAVNEFFPTGLSNFGIAPFIKQVTENDVFVNGGSTGLMRYDLDTKAMTDNAGNCTEYDADVTVANGIDYFTMGEYSYFIFPATDHRGSNGFTFNIVRSENDTFANAALMACVPQCGLGALNSSTASTPISVVKDDNGSARIYVYAVGNGIAAYKLTDNSASLDSVTASDLTMSVSGNTVSFNKTVSSCRVYGLSGMLVYEGANIDLFALPTSGHYVVVADGRVFRVAI
ncbi:MAG: family 10 glycosylhydrolase [Muribaculaceae bacterium]|nr:family 10 glycosylhydrolase [Muribaculaceae bacterium]